MGKTDVSATVMLSSIPKFCTLDINDAYKAEIEQKSYETDLGTARGDYVFRCILIRQKRLDGRNEKREGEGSFNHFSEESASRQ